MSMAPASTMPWMEFAADISGVCSMDGTLLMTSKPTSRLSTKMVISAIRAWLIGSTSGVSCGVGCGAGRGRHGWVDHLASVHDDDTGLNLVGGVDGERAVADKVPEQRADVAGVRGGGGRWHRRGQVSRADDGDPVVGCDGFLWLGELHVPAQRAGPEIDDDRTGPHVLDRLSGDQQRRPFARYLGSGDDDVVARDVGVQLVLLCALLRLRQCPRVAARGGCAADRADGEEGGAEGLHVTLGGGAHIVSGHDGAEPACGADRLQARDSRAEHEHFGRPCGARRRDEQREEARERAGGDEHGLVAGDVRLRRQRVHGLGGGQRPWNAVEADRRHAGGAELARELGLGERAQHPDDRLAGAQPGDVLRGGPADKHDDVALVQQLRTAGNARAGLGVCMVGKERGVARAPLDQYLQAKLREPVDRVWHQCHAPLARRGLLDDSYLHLRDLNDHLGTGRPRSEPEISHTVRLSPPVKSIAWAQVELKGLPPLVCGTPGSPAEAPRCGPRHPGRDPGHPYVPLTFCSRSGGPPRRGAATGGAPSPVPADREGFRPRRSLTAAQRDTDVPLGCCLEAAGPARGDQPLRRSISLIFSPAATTAGACRRPGERVSRSIGPETDTAATILPAGPRTGADTDATPASRSATLAAHPRLRTWASVAALNLAARRPRCIRSGSSQASSACAAEPAVMGSTAPTGTVSRRPLARSAAATQIRASACRRYSCALSPVRSRNWPSTGCATARSLSSPAAVASSAIRGPSVNRPWASLATSLWRSRATAIRCAVGRVSPV